MNLPYMEKISSQVDLDSITATLRHLNLIGITFTPDFIITRVSPYTLVKTGWEESELIGHNIFDKLIAVNDEQDIRQMLEEGIQGKR